MCCRRFFLTGADLVLLDLHVVLLSLTLTSTVDIRGLQVLPPLLSALPAPHDRGAITLNE